MTVPGWYWIVWLLVLVGAGFVVPEVIAWRNRRDGDTYSETQRGWWRAIATFLGHPKRWRLVWYGIWSIFAALMVWLLGHIAQWWP